jgi:hypothetical protein
VKLQKAFYWGIVLFLAAVSATLLAGPNFRSFLIYLVGILVLGFLLRDLEEKKRLKGKKRRDDE